MSRHRIAFSLLCSLLLFLASLGSLGCTAINAALCPDAEAQERSVEVTGTIHIGDETLRWWVDKGCEWLRVCTEGTMESRFAQIAAHFKGQVEVRYDTP